MNKLWKILLVFCCVIGFVKMPVKAQEEEVNGNSVTLQVTIEDIYDSLIEVNKDCYSLEGIEYTLYQDNEENSEIAVFILDKNGKGYEKTTGKDYLDNLADGDYYFEMTKGNDCFKIDEREYPFTLSAIPILPKSIKVTTVAEMFGKDSSNNYFSNNQYKLWTTDYGTGVFECGIAEVSAPSAIVNYGTHTISTSTSKVLDKASHEMIYKVLYYGRKGPKQWSGFTSGKYNVPFTTRDGSTYYKTTNSQALAAFITHVTLARAYNANNKWNLQWAQDGVKQFWSFLQTAENAPDNFVVYVWENYEKYKTQDMFFGFLADSTYDKKEMRIELPLAFDPISLVLTKKDSSNIAIPKAGFEIDYYVEEFNKLDDASGKTAIRSWVFETDDNGRLTYSDINKVSGDDLFVDNSTGNNVLLAGSYIVKEIYAPEGYLLAEPFIIKVYADIDKEVEYLNASGNRLLTNETDGYNLLELKEGYCKVNKRAIQKTDLSLQGAKYGIYIDEKCTNLAKDTNGVDAVLLTDTNGNTNTISIAPGKYFVKEIEAPKGFKLDQKIYPIIVKEMETAIVDSVEEVCMIEVTIKKVDAINGKIVSSAEYGIFDQNDNLVEKIILDENGKGSCSLQFNSEGYYLKELVAPEHYFIDKNSYQISGKEHEDVSLKFDLNDDPKVFKLRVVKLNEFEEPIENVGFKIVDENDEIVNDINDIECSGYTDIDGNLEFTLFEDGKYYLVETKAATGYRLDTTKKEICLDENVEIGKASDDLAAFEIKVINYKIPVADTGDEEFRSFVWLSIISLSSMIIAVRCKKKFVG